MGVRREKMFLITQIIGLDRIGSFRKAVVWCQAYFDMSLVSDLKMKLQ